MLMLIMLNKLVNKSDPVAKGKWPLLDATGELVQHRSELVEHRSELKIENTIFTTNSFYAIYTSSTFHHSALQLKLFCHLARADYCFSILILISSIFYGTVPRSKGWNIYSFIWYSTQRQGLEYIPVVVIFSVS
jgi:hypothetical protein